MQLEVKSIRDKDKLFRLNIKLTYDRDILFTFCNSYLIQREQLVIRTPYITTALGKRIAYLFSDRLKNYIAYHVIKNKTDNDITLQYKMNSNQLLLKKVKTFERNYGSFEVLGIYNAFIGSDIQLKHLNLLKNEKGYFVTYPRVRGKALCYSHNQKTKKLVETEIFKIQNLSNK